MFFFISGYLFTQTNVDFTQIEAVYFLKKKSIRLLVPYIVLGAVIFAIKFIFSGLSHADRDFSIASFLIMFVAPHAVNSTIGYLWYVITLFVVFAVIIFISKFRINLRNDITALALIIVCWGLSFVIKNVIWLNFSNVLWYLPFFVLGIFFKKHEASLKSLISIGVGLTCLILTICELFFKPEAPVLGLVWKVLIAVAGIIFSMSLCNVLLKSTLVQDKILPFGDRTYAIYLLSWFGQYAAKVFIINVFHLHWSIAVIGMFMCGILVPLLICKIVDNISALRNYKPLRLIIGY